MPMTFVCPYFIWEDTPQNNYNVHCECGTRVFNSVEERDRFISLFCADNPGWQNCSCARIRCEMYEKMCNDETKGSEP